ncbi:hypothetical protein [Turneriella parva]|uniref:Uncharacterized protein n=1 Tax=Turneriella parva (strain ATCC BAA-1111 / DSM 21527 / NCTC 11395 / H) TaxID=869212 RepID=I4B4B2_TURPD|nr:hypothetical protein [Turneriella parva]AFM12119.1 hypothetical protein Turpa_1471 [Turneriella parva DSM 21527]
MKKILLIMTMAGLPVFAQAKKAAKPAKKEAVPAQVAPAPQAENTEPTQPVTQWAYQVLNRSIHESAATA